MEDAKRLKGGSGNKKMKKFPRIIDYLEAHHKDIYELFDDLAMHSSLTPRRGGSITFLLPDTALVSAIRKAIESDKPEEATDMLSSLVLTDLFESPSDFQEKQDDIPNLLGKRLVVKSVSGSKVTLENGDLTVDPKFKPFERQGTARRGNLAVWLLKGKVDYETAPDATHKYAKLPPKPKKGGAEAGNLMNIMKRVLQDEVDAVKNRTSDNSGGFKSPVLNAVARLLRVFQNNAQFLDEKQKAKSLLTKHPIIDFYLLFYAPDIFASNRVLQAWNMGVDEANNVETIRNFHRLDVEGTGAVLKGNNADLAVVQQDIIGKMPINIKSAANIVKLYENMDETNELPGTPGKIYPENLAAIFRAKKGMHLALDEFKFYVYSAVNWIKTNMPNDPVARAAEYANLFSSIHASYPKLGSRGVSMLLNPLLDKNDVQFVEKFWKSFGLNMPACCETDLEKRVVEGGDEDCDECDSDDVAAEIEQDLSMYSNCDLTLSPSTISELKAYVKLNGKMPEL